MLIQFTAASDRTRLSGGEEATVNRERMSSQCSFSCLYALLLIRPYHLSTRCIKPCPSGSILSMSLIRILHCTAVVVCGTCQMKRLPFAVKIASAYHWDANQSVDHHWLLERCKRSSSTSLVHRLTEQPHVIEYRTDRTTILEYVYRDE